MLRLSAGLVAGVLIAGAAIPAAAQATATELHAELKGLAADREALLLVMAEWAGPVAAQHVPATLDHIADILDEPQLAQYLMREMPPRPGEDIVDYAVRFSLPVGYQLVLHGMQRLSPEVQLEQLRIAVRATEYMQATTPQRCAAFNDDTLDYTASRDLEAAFVATLSTDEVAAMLPMTRAALLAELSNADPVMRVTPAEAEAAMAQYRAAIQEAIAVSDNPMGMYMVLTGAAPQASLYCDYVLLAHRTTLALPSPERERVILMLYQAIP